LEQLYPFPDKELDVVLAAYPKLESVVWCQEEPMNQGAWYSSQHHMRNAMQRHDSSLQLSYAGRIGSAAPASGYMSVHLEEQKQFIDEALTFDS
jgi:2-oxoglutarate dehydrogenase E1 component